MDARSCGFGTAAADRGPSSTWRATAARHDYCRRHKQACAPRGAERGVARMHVTGPRTTIRTEPVMDHEDHSRATTRRDPSSSNSSCAISRPLAVRRPTALLGGAVARMLRKDSALRGYSTTTIMGCPFLTTRKTMLLAPPLAVVTTCHSPGGW